MSQSGQEYHLHNVGSRETHRVDPAHHERFRDPDRLETLRPDELVQHLDVQPGDTVLDLGCGDGLLFEPLAERVGETGRVIGLDIERKMVELARENAREAGLENVRVHESADDALPLDDGVGQAAILVNALHEMASPERTLRELARVLEPGAQVLVCDRKKEETGEEGPPKHHLISREEARAYFQEAGFEGVDAIDWTDPLYVLRFRKR